MAEGQNMVEITPEMIKAVVDAIRPAIARDSIEDDARAACHAAFEAAGFQVKDRGQVWIR